MKKETLLMKLSILVIFAFIWVFVYIMKNNEDIQPLNHLMGSWKIVATVQNDDIKIEDQKTIFFDDKNAIYQTKDIQKEDTYKYSDNLLKVFNKTYTVDCKTEDYIRIYEDKSNYMILIQWKEDYLDNNVTKDFLNGKWKVIYKNYYHKEYQEILEFNNDTLIDYRNDSVFLKSEVSFDKQYITVNELNQSHYLLPLTNDEIIIVELDTSTVWKLERVNDEESNI